MCPEVVDPHSGKMGLFKYALSTLGEALLDWVWVNEVKWTFYTGFNTPTDEHLRYAAFDVAVLLIIMKNRRVFYANATDTTRVRIGNIEVDSRLLDKIGTPAPCKVSKKIELQMISYHQIVELASQ